MLCGGIILNGRTDFVFPILLITAHWKLDVVLPPIVHSFPKAVG